MLNREKPNVTVARKDSSYVGISLCILLPVIWYEGHYCDILRMKKTLTRPLLYSAMEKSMQYPY